MEDQNSNQNPNNDEVIDLFIDGIMIEKGVDAPTDEIHQKIHDDLRTQLLTEIDRSLVAELPEDQIDKLYQLADQNGGQLDPNTVAAAIEAAGIDTTDVVGVTMQRFRELYLKENPASPDAQPVVATETELQGA